MTVLHGRIRHVSVRVGGSQSMQVLQTHSLSHTHTGHRSAVNFRLSGRTATKSIIEVTNARPGAGVSD